MIPNPGDWTVYGVALIVVIGAVRYLARYYFGPDSQGELVTTIVATIVGYLLVQNLGFLEGLVPGLPIWLPQVFNVVLILGALLGFTPGEKFGRFVNWVGRLGKKSDTPWIR